MNLFSQFDAVQDWGAVKQRALVAVRWMDAVSLPGPWVDLDTEDGLDSIEVADCVTVGFFYRVTDKSVTLYATGGDEEDSVGGVWIIPVGWITEAVLISTSPLEEEETEDERPDEHVAV